MLKKYYAIYVLILFLFVVDRFLKYIFFGLPDFFQGYFDDILSFHF